MLEQDQVTGVNVTAMTEEVSVDVGVDADGEEDNAGGDGDDVGVIGTAERESGGEKVEDDGVGAEVPLDGKEDDDGDADERKSRSVCREESDGGEGRHSAESGGVEESDDGGGDNGDGDIVVDDDRFAVDASGRIAASAMGVFAARTTKSLPVDDGSPTGKDSVDKNDSDDIMCSAVEHITEERDTTPVKKFKLTKITTDIYAEKRRDEERNKSNTDDAVNSTANKPGMTSTKSPTSSSAEMTVTTSPTTATRTTNSPDTNNNEPSAPSELSEPSLQPPSTEEETGRTSSVREENNDLATVVTENDDQLRDDDDGGDSDSDSGEDGEGEPESPNLGLDESDEGPTSPTLIIFSPRCDFPDLDRYGPRARTEADSVSDAWNEIGRAHV